MRGIAEYVMHGRRQAIIIVLLCGFFPLLYFVSAAVVGLVTLRRGGNEGLMLLLWSLLPAAVMFRLGDAGPAFVVAGVYLLAMLLRHGQSWQQVILAATFLSLLVQLSLHFQETYVANMRALFGQVFTVEPGTGIEADFATQQVVELMLDFYGAFHGFVMLGCLILARWWQAMLYNPGGFRREFHQLRFDPRIMLVLAGLLLGAMAGVEPLASWQAVFTLPPILGGLAAMHGLIALKKMGGQWLILGYLLLVLLSPAVILLGILDSLFDFRKRITT